MLTAEERARIVSGRVFCPPSSIVALAKSDAEREAEIARLKRENWQLQAFRLAIPQTYGEVVLKCTLPPPCEPHEWDNRTSPENACWALFTAISIAAEVSNQKRAIEELAGALRSARLALKGAVLYPVNPTIKVVETAIDLAESISKGGGTSSAPVERYFVTGPVEGGYHWWNVRDALDRSTPNFAVVSITADLAIAAQTCQGIARQLNEAGPLCQEDCGAKS